MKTKKRYLLGLLLCCMLCGCESQLEEKTQNETESTKVEYAIQNDYVAVGTYKGLIVKGKVNKIKEVGDVAVEDQMKKILVYASEDENILVSDENVKKYVANTDSVESFKEQVKENLKASRTYEDYQYNKQMLFGQIYRTSKLLSYEPEFYKEVKEQILETHKGDAIAGGYKDLDTYIKACGYETYEAFETEYLQAEVEEYLLSEYIFRAIRDENNLEASEKQVSELCKTMAAQQNISEEEVKTQLGGEEGIKRQAEIQNVYDFLFANNTIE